MTLGYNGSDKPLTTSEHPLKPLRKWVQNQWETDIIFRKVWVWKMFHNMELFLWYRKKFFHIETKETRQNYILKAHTKFFVKYKISLEPL